MTPPSKEQQLKGIDVALQSISPRKRPSAELSGKEKKRLIQTDPTTLYVVFLSMLICYSEYMGVCVYMCECMCVFTWVCIMALSMWVDSTQHPFHFTSRPSCFSKKKNSSLTLYKNDFCFIWQLFFRLKSKVPM